MGIQYICDGCGKIERTAHEFRGGTTDMETFELSHLCEKCCKKFDKLLVIEKERFLTLLREKKEA